LDLSNEVKDLKGKRVLVLDDIVTTGSTVKELRRLLLEEGAAAVDCLCLAH
jgi:predicted amidophosphoribosyltransferase